MTLNIKQHKKTHWFILLLKTVCFKESVYNIPNLRGDDESYSLRYPSICLETFYWPKDQLSTDFQPSFNSHLLVTAFWPPFYHRLFTTTFLPPPFYHHLFTTTFLPPPFYHHLFTTNFSLPPFKRCLLTAAIWPLPFDHCLLTATFISW